MRKLSVHLLVIFLIGIYIMRLISNEILEVKKDAAKEEDVSKIVFMKTHKTGSSTIQNILFRYASNRNWNIVLPTSGYSFDCGVPFRSSMASGVEWEEMVKSQGYNLFALHTKYHHPEVTRIMGNGMIYVTILRDPVDQFISAFKFYNYNVKFNTANLRDFIQKVVLLGKGVSSGLTEVPYSYWGRNHMLVDLGMKPADTLSKERVLSRVEEIHKEFHLVMILERWEESLVLFSELSGIPLANLTSLKVNENYKNGKEEVLSPEEREILRNWLWADQQLYQRFSDEFEEKVKEYGDEKMRVQKEALCQLNLRTEMHCVNTQDLWKFNGAGRNWKGLGGRCESSLSDFDLKSSSSSQMCDGLGIGEFTFMDRLRDKHLERFKKWEEESSNENIKNNLL